MKKYAISPLLLAYLRNLNVLYTSQHEFQPGHIHCTWNFKYARYGRQRNLK